MEISSNRRMEWIQGAAVISSRKGGKRAHHGLRLPGPVTARLMHRALMPTQFDALNPTENAETIYQIDVADSQCLGELLSVAPARESRLFVAPPTTTDLVVGNRAGVDIRLALQREKGHHPGGRWCGVVTHRRPRRRWPCERPGRLASSRTGRKARRNCRVRCR